VDEVQYQGQCVLVTDSIGKSVMRARVRPSANRPCRLDEASVSPIYHYSRRSSPSSRDAAEVEAFKAPSEVETQLNAPKKILTCLSLGVAPGASALRFDWFLHAA
jgi:hypothetical protein